MGKGQRDVLLLDDIQHILIGLGGRGELGGNLSEKDLADFDAFQHSVQTADVVGVRVGCQSVVQRVQPQRIQKGQNLIALVVFTGIDEHGALLGGDEDAFALPDIDDVDLGLSAGRQRRSR